MDRQDSKQFDFPFIHLLENVDRLTQPYEEVVEQEVNGKRQTVKISRKALFDQLEESIYSTQTSARRGGALASERNVIDASAYMLRATIHDAIFRMHRPYRRRPVRSMKSALRQWYVSFKEDVERNRPSEKVVWRMIKETGAWIRAIETKFDPPITLEVTRPCPNCEHQHVYTEDNEQVAAVVITWQKSFDKSEANCRACDKSWYGESELRSLRYEIDQRDALRGEG